jgi:1,2-diacylglycerol 3-alpha-glucosyltransferase
VDRSLNMSVKMRIVHVTGFFIEGMSYQENLLPAGQAALGHDVHVISGTRDPDFGFNSETRFHLIGEFHYRGFTVKRIAHWLDLGNRGPVFKGLYGAIAQLRPDVLFIHDIGTALLTGIHYKLRNPGVRLQMDCHSDVKNARTSTLGPAYHYFFKWVFRWFGSNFERFFAVAPSAAEFMTTYYGLARERVTLLPLPGDNSVVARATEIRGRVRRERGVDERHQVLVHTGKMPGDKETLAVLKMFQTLPGSQLRLWLIGDIDRGFQPVFERFRDADPRIEYLGWLDADKLRETFAACDLLVAPGSLSHTFVDAICAGLPVVLDETSQGRYLTQWGNGMTVPRGSIDALAAAVSQALTPVVATSMRKAAVSAGHWLDYRNIGRISLSSVSVDRSLSDT